MATIGDGFKDIFLAGIGAMAITAEKSKDLVDQLISKGELTVDQGKQINTELKHEAEDVASTLRYDALEARMAVMTPEERAAFAAKAAEIARWKEYFLDDAQQVFVSYGSAARSALHLVHTLRGKGIRAGLLELQTLWPFPAELVRDRTEGARNVYVVEMNMGHIMAQVRQAAWKPDRVFLVNRVDGQLITPTDIGKVMRVIEGRGF